MVKGKKLLKKVHRFGGVRVERKRESGNGGLIHSAYPEPSRENKSNKVDQFKLSVRTIDIPHFFRM